MSAQYEWVDAVIDGMNAQRRQLVQEEEPTDPDPLPLVRFIDYDGTVLSEQEVAVGADATPPTQPTHDGLTFVEWNNAYTNVTENVDIGAIYQATDGKSKIKIRLSTASGLAPTLYFNKSDTSTLTINWGDGSADTAISTAGDVNTGAHTYAAAGVYSITAWISAGTGTYTFGNTGSTPMLAGNYLLARTDIVIGSNVVATIRKAFNVQGLYTVVLPPTLLTLEQELFYNAYNLCALCIPTTVTLIKDICRGCKSMTYVAVPAAIGVAGDYAFSGCSALRSLIVLTHTASYTFANSTDMNSLAYLRVPSATIYLSMASAFSLRRLYVPSTVASLTLTDARVLTTLNVPTVTTLVATGCYSLQEVTYGGTAVGASAFAGCTSLRKVTFMGALATIGNYAFDGCNSLEAVVLPETVTAIGAYAFRNCYNLRTANIPTAAKNGLDMTGSQFENCYSLEEITVPDNTMLMASMFSGCRALRKVTFLGGASNSATSLFNGCVGLEELVLPSSMSVAGLNFAYNCSGLRRIVIPANLTTIPGSFCRGCYSLHDIEFAGAPSSIGTYAFSGTGITGLTFPEGLTTLGTYAFASCLLLRTLDLPSTLTSIQTAAIQSCTLLRELVVRNTTPPTYTASAISPNAGLRIYVPDASVAAYKAATNWTALANYIVPLSERSL